MIDMIEQEKLKEDRKRVNDFTSEWFRYKEKKEKRKRQDKLDDLFMIYLDGEECSKMTFEELEILRKYHTYIRENV